MLVIIAARDKQPERIRAVVEAWQGMNNEARGMTGCSGIGWWNHELVRMNCSPYLTFGLGCPKGGLRVSPNSTPKKYFQVFSTQS
jgi:hypothetical protein